MTRKRRPDSLDRNSGSRGFSVEGAVMDGIWLVFLGYPVISLVAAPVSGPWKVLGLVLVLCFAALYVLGFGWQGRLNGTQVYLWILCLAVLVLPLVPMIGWMVFSFTTYFVAVFVFVLPRRPGIVWMVLLLAAGVAAVLLFRPEYFWYISGALLLGPVIVVVVALMDHREKRRTVLERRLAVSEERDAVARDVHDVLGHSLTVINLKAEVAGRVLEADPARARQEMEEIARLSRLALAEVRSTVTRLRVPDLAAELEAAARALRAAGISADLPDPESAQQSAGTNATLYSWALREAVTNVVRHSAAARCTVRISPEQLLVQDDGIGTGAARGNGLSGLEQRVEEAGGRLLVDPVPAPDAERAGTRLVVSMDGSDPSARTLSRTAPFRDSDREEHTA